MGNTDKNQTITKISQVTPEVTLFLRKLGFSNYYIIKIFALVGEAAIALTEDNPYWLLSEFPAMKFDKVDKAAEAMGMETDNVYRIEAAIKHGLSLHVGNGNTFVPAREFYEQIAGFLDLSREVIEDVAEDMTLAGDLQIAVVDGREVLYFYGYYKTECQIVSRIREMISADFSAAAEDIDYVIRKAESMTDISLSNQQREAVKNSLKRNISIITGGPGTGKTTIIEILVKIMEESGMSVAVAAPTGRAAKRITEAGGKEAVTLHRLLEYYYDEVSETMAFGRNESNPLDYDVVIVDESSMIDLMLMGALCRALKQSSRLIMTGDKDQLPSVGAGNVLSDLIDSGYIYTSRLTEVFRQRAESNIVLNAHRINGGQYPHYGGDFVLVKADKQNEILEKTVKLASGLPACQVQVITPTKKGILGSINLNESFQKVFNPAAVDKPEMVFGNKVFRVGDRIMQIKNNYRLEYNKKSGKSGKGVFNGEMGIVSAVYPDDGKLVVEYDDERWVEYPYVQLDEIELAYAITVHKSQGSEFPKVIIPMSWFPPALATKNLIYTAVTRGKEQVVIVGNGDYLNAMVDNVQSGKRNSGLKERLINVYEGI